MNPFVRKTFRRGRAKGGFSLVETVLSLGIVSFGFLSLISMMSLGLKTARQARDNRTSAQIAQTLVEEARQGTLTAGTLYLDAQANPCGSIEAAYTVQSTLQPLPPLNSASTSFLTRLTLRVTPLGAPDRTRIYAVVYPVQP